MKSIYQVILAGSILSATLLFAACQGASTSSEAAEEEEHHHNESTATLTEQQIQNIGITYTQIEQQNLDNSVVLNGALAVPNDHKAFVSAIFGGILKSVHVQPGDVVKKGQVLGMMINPDLLPLQQELQSVQNQINLATLEVNRQKELVEGNAAPLKRLQQVETELANLKVQRNSLSNQLKDFGASLHNSSMIALKAPISGVVTKVFSQIGSNVDKSTPILEIVNNNEIHLDLFLYEKDLQKVSKGQKIYFSTVNNPNQRYEAQIILIGAAFENNGSAVAVHANVLGDKKNLIEGMQVTASLVVNNKTVPAIPSDAIVNFQGNDFIFILTDEHAESEHHDHDHAETENHDHGAAGSHHAHTHEKGEVQSKNLVFERIPVVKGVSSNGYTEITPLKEMSKDTKIVNKGAFFLLAKMTNAGEHSH